MALACGFLLGEFLRIWILTIISQGSVIACPNCTKQAGFSPCKIVCSAIRNKIAGIPKKLSKTALNWPVKKVRFAGIGAEMDPEPGTTTLPSDHVNFYHVPTGTGIAISPVPSIQSIILSCYSPFSPNGDQE